MDAPKKLADFYQHAVNVLYALVVTEGFTITNDLLFPKNSTSIFSIIEQIFVFIFVYFFIITSWIGYFKSITAHEHSTGRIGIARFFLDLILIYLYHLLVIAVSKNSYHLIFIWILPLITSIYVLWDFFKWLEYRPKPHELRNRLNRWLISGVFFIGIIIQAYINNLSISNLPTIKFGDYIIWPVLFSISSFIMTLLYRRRKWLIKEKSG